MFEKFLERRQAKSKPRFAAFVTGKKLYDSYLADHPLSFARLGPDDYRRAAGDSRLAQAEVRYRAAVDGARQDNRSDDVATGLEELGKVHHLRGEFGEAAACFGEAISIYEDMGRLDRAKLATLGTCHFNLGIMAYRQGDADAGRTYLEQSIAVDEKNKDVAGCAETRKVIAFLEKQAAG